MVILTVVWLLLLPMTVVDATKSNHTRGKVTIHNFSVYNTLCTHAGPACILCMLADTKPSVTFLSWLQYI